MKKLIELLFGKKYMYGMGSLPSPADTRNIDIARVQAPVKIPDFHMTDLSLLGVEDQGSRPSCVGWSFAKMAEYYIWKRTGIVARIDGDRLYNDCKKEDGIPDTEGTYASVAAKIVVRDGVDQKGKKDTNDKFATGYAFVSADYEAICQAIYQNGIITIGLLIDGDWYRGIIGRVLRWIGGHQTDLHGYDKATGRLYGINSWSNKWIGQIAGMIDDRVKPGHYVAQFDDIKHSVISIIALVPIPKDILDEVKNTGYRFTENMRIGQRSYQVLKLQEKLNVEPKTGYFGPITQEKVKAFQLAHGIHPDGIVGPITREKLNIGTKNFIPQWIEAIKVMEGAKKALNNPGNIKCDAVMHRDATGMDYRGICKFPSYEKGYKALERMLTNACTGKSKRYPPWLTLLQFYAGVRIDGIDYGGYAPDADNNNSSAYANFVAKRLGVSPVTRIQELL